MKIIGHQGAKGLLPGNTLPSLAKAVELGVDEIEIDVRVTSDGVPVLNHDAALKDKFDNPRFIADNKYADLKKIKPDLTKFEDAISEVNKRVPLLIEVKPDESIQPIVETINKYLAKGWRPKNFLLGSFSQKVLLELQQDLPHIEKVVIDSWSGVRASRRAKRLGAKRLNMNHRWLWSGFIRSMTTRGYKLSAYTVNSPEKARRWAKHGLAGVITDYPDRFKN